MKCECVRRTADGCVQVKMQISWRNETEFRALGISRWKCKCVDVSTRGRADVKCKCVCGTADLFVEVCN